MDIVVIILGFIFMFSEKCVWHAYEFYGGDTYTGIQNATTAASNNIQILNANLISVPSKTSLFVGAFLIGLSFCVSEDKTAAVEVKKEETPAELKF